MELIKCRDVRWKGPKKRNKPDVAATTAKHPDSRSPRFHATVQPACMRSVSFLGKFTSGSRISASRSDLLKLPFFFPLLENSNALAWCIVCFHWGKKYSFNLSTLAWVSWLFWFHLNFLPAFYFLDVLQRDNNSNRAYGLGRKYVLFYYNWSRSLKIKTWLPWLNTKQNRLWEGLNEVSRCRLSVKISLLCRLSVKISTSVSCR